MGTREPDRGPPYVCAGVNQSAASGVSLLKAVGAWLAHGVGMKHRVDEKSAGSGIRPGRRARVARAIAVGVLGLATLLVAAGAGFAQTTANEGDGRVASNASVKEAARRGKIAAAINREEYDLDIDGKLDEEIWRNADFVSGFTQRQPDEGEPSTEHTEIAVIFDNKAIYIGARLYSSVPVNDLMTRRDELGQAERLIVSLDTYLDRRTAYTLAVTAGGVRVDWFTPSDNEFDRDFTWDPVWEAGADVDSAGWTAEMRIPLSQLRFNKRQEHVWGLNVKRYIPTKNESSYWVMIPLNEQGWSSWFGELHGINDIRPSRRMEFAPYVASATRMTSPSLVNAEDPFAKQTDVENRIGGDFKMGLGPSLTLDLTINPDFGQIEADPATVNLSAFETIFDERRPFFTEGANLFEGNGAGPRYFFSRRIGAPPHRSGDGQFVDQPDVTTIIGAAKLTGRTPGGLSVGILGAATSAEYARSFDSDVGIEDQLVEPSAGWGVVRLRQEFGENASTVGFIGTGVRRSQSVTDPTFGLLANSAFTGGGDFNLRFDGGKYELSGHGGLSYVSGSEDAIARIQSGSAHYFQRPDQDHVSFDPTRTSLTGYSGSLQIRKRSGEHWLWNGGIWADSPSWELNDVGQLGSGDDIQSWANVRYRENEQGKIFRRYNIGLNTGMGWNFGGVRKNSRLGGFSWGQFHNFMDAIFFWNYFPQGMSDNLTRGGPLMGTNTAYSLGAEVSSNQSANIAGSLEGFYGNRNGSDWEVQAGLRMNAGPRMQIEISPSYGRFSNDRQYVSTEERADQDRTFGNRYIFGTVDQSVLSTEVRLNYSFTPNLNLELYAEPFSASGRYSSFGELPEARSRDLRAYGTDGTTITENADGSFSVTDGAEGFDISNRNFNVLSFRSNLVLRWEFIPGSTAFFVWQQDRSEFANDGRLARPDDLLASMGSAGRNIIAIKVKYWMGM